MNFCFSSRKSIRVNFVSNFSIRKLSINKFLVKNMAVNYDREEFRKYLQDSGAVTALSNVLLKLYELKYSRPKTAVIYIRDHLLDELPSLTEYDNLKAESKATSDILVALKNNEQLNDAQLAMINNITSSKAGQGQGGLISARQSQIVKGNKWKNSSKNQSKIRNVSKVDPDAYLKYMQKAFNELQNDRNCKSLLKLHLKEDMFNSLFNETTSAGSTLIDCISSGLEIHESMVGVYAADEDAYDKFKDLFDPLIADYHKGFDVNGSHTTYEWGDPSDFKDLDPNNEFIASTRIRCIRTVKNFPLIPKMDEKQFSDLCTQIKEVLENLTGDVKGKWYGLETLDAATKREMIDKRYILEYGDRFLEAAGAIEYWPIGRAVYINDAKTFFVWVNEEDHLRFISMQAGCNIPVIYNRLINAVTQCSEKLDFAKHSRFGFLALCPTNLGNTIRASVMIKIPKLMKQMATLETLAEKFKLELRHGYERTNSETVEISNKRKLGLSPHDSIKELYDGIKVIIDMERTF